MSTITDYERCLLTDKISCALQNAGLYVSDTKVRDFVRDMVVEQDKARLIPETVAVKELVYWLENEADMDDLAREYSLIKTNYRIRITRNVGGGASSDVFKDGVRVEE